MLQKFSRCFRRFFAAFTFEQFQRMQMLLRVFDVAFAVLFFPFWRNELLAVR